MKIKIIESKITQPKSASSVEWQAILEASFEMMELGCEPRSALKQCASDAGIPFGEKMGEFVEWAEAQF